MAGMHRPWVRKWDKVLRKALRMSVRDSKKGPKAFPIQGAILGPPAAIEVIRETWEDEARRIEETQEQIAKDLLNELDDEADDQDADVIEEELDN